MEKEEISQAICKSRECDKIIRFMKKSEMTDAFVEEYEIGNIQGVYYCDNKIVYETRDGKIIDL